MRFDHLLLTRFSAALYPGAPLPTEEWLWYRLGFFYDTAYPSVQAQTTRPDAWLVLFDERCPDDFRAEVEGLATGGVFTPVWTAEPFRRDTFASLVAERATAPWLITTRLDSDDALARGFVADVQARFAGQEREFVTFPRGAQVDRAGAVYRSDYVSNPFLSLIERRTDAPPATVYVTKHSLAARYAALTVVRTPGPQWLQVVHDLNVSNIVNGVLTSPRALETFAITLPYDTDAHGASLLRARLAQARRLAGLWRRNPGEFVRWIEGRIAGVRGTYRWPQGRPDLTTRVLRATARLRGRPVPPDGTLAP